jgi:hypothetical protein
VLRALLPDDVIKSAIVFLCCLAAPVAAQNSPCTSGQRAEYLQMLQQEISTNNQYQLATTKPLSVG